MPTIKRTASGLGGWGLGLRGSLGSLRGPLSQPQPPTPAPRRVLGGQHEDGAAVNPLAHIDSNGR